MSIARFPVLGIGSSKLVARATWADIATYRMQMMVVDGEVDKDDDNDYANLRTKNPNCMTPSLVRTPIGMAPSLVTKPNGMAS